MDWEQADASDKIRMTCSCPYYADGMFCKHCWAAILCLDQEGVGAGIPGSRKPKLIHEVFSEFIEKANRRESRFGPTSSAPKAKQWLKELRSLQGDDFKSGASGRASSTFASLKNTRTAFYILDIEESRTTGDVVIDFYHQETLKSGLIGAVKHLRVSRNDIPLYSSSIDRELMSLLLAYPNPSRYPGYYISPTSTQAKSYIPMEIQKDLLEKLTRTGRLYRSPLNYGEFRLDDDSNGAQPLRLDEEDPLKLVLSVTKRGAYFDLDGFLVRKGERIPIVEPALCLRTGWVVFDDRIVRLEATDHFDWIAKLRNTGFYSIPEQDGDELVEALAVLPNCPPIEWPEELRWKQEKVTGSPIVVFTAPPINSSTRGILADLRFTYSDQTISITDKSTTLLDKPNRRMIQRDIDFERISLEKLSSIEGMAPAPSEHSKTYPFRIFPNQLTAIVHEINAWGWRVEAYGKLVRPPAEFKIQVSSGVDWFDLNAKVNYTESFSLTLPALIVALQRGENLIPLGDGSLGMLPTDWLKKYAPLAQMGAQTQDGFRFNRSQGAILSAWVSTEAEAMSDPEFLDLMHDISKLGKLKPKSPSRSFRGELRSYQKEGLAWLDFLKRLSFGGILADDMGLGKTIQVLAHLEAEYVNKSSRPDRPSIVILPKSLLFNWQQESMRFTPKLRVLAYTGQSRSTLLNEIPHHDLVLVTYPILRLDFNELKKFDFHYVIADEAQAIKNAESLSHKACCLLRGTHRLAMTGTPVENSIEDLFAMLDFVSPGLLGSSVRQRMSQAATHGKLDTSALDQLAQALKPFILRRTKGQVLKDLPEKTEKILHCELSAQERKHYVELRDHYRDHLRGEIERRGLARSKIVILEALLRLRQAACHPGLIDKKRIGSESAKVETLIAQLQSVISEGHKALVFSQFTSFLDIVEKKLKSEKIRFRRLDGKTGAEERRQRVAEFQENPTLKIFLISLKAGGVGLNLTAADYVFILDPWWNPAAESQAIDRTHRIGQKNKVIAYRLIAKDTVEEKIVELQESKRALADAIITADASLLRKMTAEDIEVLLS
jgi:superfamily II DNA or RNA helicase